MEDAEPQGSWHSTSIFDARGPLTESEWPAFIASLHMLVEQHIRSLPFGDDLGEFSAGLHVGVDGLAMMMSELYDCDEYPEVLHTRRRARGASCMVIDALLTLTTESPDEDQRRHQMGAIQRIRATLDEIVIGANL